MLDSLSKHIFHIILASSSPRRHDLLKEAKFNFSVISPCIDEEKIEGFQDPENAAIERARAKAQAVRIRIRENLISHPNLPCVILGADTLVSLPNEILGKPRDPDDAFRMLYHLSRNPHRVITGVCVWPLNWEVPLIGTESTKVKMNPMTPDEIWGYIESGEAMGKAGAYAIQETGDRFISSIEGESDNVVGLPIGLLNTLLKKWLSAEGYFGLSIDGF